MWGKDKDSVLAVGDDELDAGGEVASSEVAKG